MTTSKKKPQRFGSVWDAISDTPEEAANMAARSELMRAITALIRDSGWTQDEAAARCGVSQPRISDLMRGCVSKFSLDALFNIAAALHKRVHMQLEDFDEDRRVAHA